MMHDLSAFVTGSQVYGTPRPDSDIDIKVFMFPRSQADINLLGSLADEYVAEYNLVRFGKLHMQLITDPIEFTAWREATERLRSMKPVTNREATDLINHYRLAAGDNPFAQRP